jgi:hypothetical membrane protein
MDTHKEPRSPDTATAASGDRPARVDTISSACGGIALVGVAAITVICLAVQFFRTDLNWITTEMSIYVIGPWGSFVQASFFAPAPGLAALGFAWHHTLLRRQAGSFASFALFVLAAVALCFTGAFVPDKTAWPVTIHGAIHQWAAFGTFVFVTTAMVLQSWWFRYDPHWRKHFPDAFALAMVTIVYFWIYALIKPIPRGIGEKAVIGLVLLWVWRAAWWLVRDRSRVARRPA